MYAVWFTRVSEDEDQLSTKKLNDQSQEIFVLFPESLIEKNEDFWFVHFTDFYLLNWFIEMRGGVTCLSHADPSCPGQRGV